MNEPSPDTKRKAGIHWKAATIVAMITLVLGWISLWLRINPACGSTVPEWVPSILTLVLLIVSAPGWIGLILLDIPSYPYAALIGFSFTQFIFYYSLTSFIIFISGKMKQHKLPRQL